jgi:hypothetical protein
MLSAWRLETHAEPCRIASKYATPNRSEKKTGFFKLFHSHPISCCVISFLEDSQELLPASAKCENVRSVERTSHSHVEAAAATPFVA